MFPSVGYVGLYENSGCRNLNWYVGYTITWNVELDKLVEMNMGPYIQIETRFTLKLYWANKWALININITRIHKII
jgi:hypothetical protein